MSYDKENGLDLVFAVILGNKEKYKDLLPLIDVYIQMDKKIKELQRELDSLGFREEMEIK